MNKRLTLLLAAVLMTGGLLAPTPATATVTGTIPAGAGGGTFTVELADFQYPVDNGCYEPTTSFFEVTYASPRPDFDYVVLDLTVRDSIGRVTHSFFEFEETGGRYTLDQQFCFSSDALGTFVASGEIRFETSGTGDFVVPVTETFTLSAPPAAAVNNPAPPAVDRACVRAKKVLKRVKKQDRPFSVIQKAKRKKNRVC